MTSRSGRLVKAKSQELLETIDSESPTSNGFTSKMKRVFGSPLMKKRRAQSLDILGSTLTFGVPLTQLPTSSEDPRKVSSPTDTHQPIIQSNIPLIVQKIVEHIEEHGLNQEGIYRVNGNSKLIEKLRTTFDQNGDADLTIVDIYSIGGLLKLFLRRLPDPLIPDATTNKIVDLQETIGGSYTSSTITILKNILSTLPKPHYHLLRYLCRHLLLVSEHSDTNKMTSVSLSIVFGPNVFRCGGELIGLRKQGYANSAFAQMIINYYSLFENKLELNKMRTISEVSDDVFLSPVSTKAPTDFTKKEKPDIPKPYHQYIAEKHQKTDTPTGDIDIHTSMSTDISKDEMEPVSPHERSVDEAIDEAIVTVAAEHEEMKRKRKKKAENWMASVKSKSLNDDALTTRAPSPYSWKSSPGTSPSVSPVLTPRTSQVYTSLIDDSIQDHFVQNTAPIISHSSSCTQQPDTLSTRSENSSTTVPYQVLPSSSEGSTTTELNRETVPSSSNESVNSPFRRESFTRRNNRTLRNRKSAIFGSANEGTLNENIKDMDVQVLTVNCEGDDTSTTQQVRAKEGRVSELVKEFDEEERDEKNKTHDQFDGDRELLSSSDSVKKAKDMFEKTGVMIKPATEKCLSQLLSKEEKPTAPSDSGSSIPPSSPKVPQKPQKSSEDHNNKIKQDKVDVEGGYRAHDFDYVTRQIETLVHPTLQRAKGPRNRARPSRGRQTSTSTIGTSDADIKEQNVKTPTEKKVHFEEITVTMSKREKHRLHKEQQTKTTISPIKSTQDRLSPTTAILYPSSHDQSKQDRLVSISSLTSVSTISRPNSLSSPGHKNTIETSPVHVVTSHLPPTQEQSTEDSPLHVRNIAPEGKPTVSHGWTGGVEDQFDLGSVNYERQDKEEVEEISNYQQLNEEAKKLRDIVRRFEADYMAKKGRKPLNEEKYPVAAELSSLSVIKKKLKALRSTEDPLNKSAPAEVAGERSGWTGRLASLSAVKIDEDLSPSLERKKVATVRRHQSLIVSPTHAKESPPFEQIVKMLANKRATDGRPDDIKLMTHNQLMEEKHAVQKALLHYERKHGRPQNSDNKNVMRPIYNYYRDIKKLLSVHEGRQRGLLSQSTNEELGVTGDSFGSLSLLHSSLAHSLPTAPPLTLPELYKEVTLSKTIPATTTTNHEIPSIKKDLLPSKPVKRHKPTLSAPEAVHFSGRKSRGQNQITSPPPLSPLVFDDIRRSNSKSASTSQVPKVSNNEWMSNEEIQKASVTELHHQLLLAQTKKKELRKELRAFENEFLTKHKRPVQKDDKKTMYKQYIDYRMVKVRLSLLDTLLSKWEPQHTM